MKQQNVDTRVQNRAKEHKPEIRDDLDSRKNEEFKTKKDMKKAEIQNKKKQKENKSEE